MVYSMAPLARQQTRDASVDQLAIVWNRFAALQVTLSCPKGMNAASNKQGWSRLDVRVVKPPTEKP